MRTASRLSHMHFIARYLISLLPCTTLRILPHMAVSLNLHAYMRCLRFLAPQIHFDRYKHSIYSHCSDPFLRALGTRDAASTRFHACERFDRCSFVDVPLYDFGAKGAEVPLSKEGKKVVYVNAVNMACARWEDYQANVRRRVLRGEGVDSLVSHDVTQRWTLIFTDHMRWLRAI